MEHLSFNRSAALQSVVVASVLVIASAAHASSPAQRYVEVWNPPESQLSKGKIKTHGVAGLPAKKKHKNPVVKRVADKTTLAPAAVSSAPGRLKSDDKPTKQTPLLPPLIGPDGRVLRVGYSSN